MILASKKSSAQEKQITEDAVGDLTSDQKFPTQNKESHVEQTIIISTKIRSTIEPCKIVKRDTCVSSPESSESDFDKTTLHDLTGQTFEGANHLQNTQYNTVIDKKESDGYNSQAAQKQSANQNVQSHQLDTTSITTKESLKSIESWMGYMLMLFKPYFSVLVPIIYILCAQDLLSHSRMYGGPFAWKACMKPAVSHSLSMKDLDIMRKDCFYKSDKKDFRIPIFGSPFMQLYKQEVQVYLMNGDGEFIQNATAELAVSDHQPPLQLFNQQEYQHDPVEVLDGPIQHPAQNDTGVLAISNQESPLQMYNQDQPQHHPDPVEVLEGPIQHPQQNDAAVLAITHQEPIPNINDRQQLPNNHAAVVIYGDLIPQLTLVIAVTVVVMAILTKNFIW